MNDDEQRTSCPGAHDVVALERAPRPVATELHRDALGNAGTDQGPDCGPTQIVRVPAGTARGATRGSPTLSEAADRARFFSPPAPVGDLAKEHVRQNVPGFLEPFMLDLLRLEQRAQGAIHRERPAGRDPWRSRSTSRVRRRVDCGRYSRSLTHIFENRIAWARAVSADEDRRPQVVASWCRFGVD